MKLQVYADGSCYPNPGPEGGWGAVILAGEAAVLAFGRVLEPETTNNKMELAAIIEALRLLPATDPRHEIVLYSDSEWSIKSINGQYRARKNVEMIERARAELFRLGWTDRCIRLEHVRGHQGEPCNELADGLAGKGAEAVPYEPVWEGRRVFVVDRAASLRAEPGLESKVCMHPGPEFWTWFDVKERVEITFLP